jgi:hypothetical protein
VQQTGVGFAMTHAVEHLSVMTVAHGQGDPRGLGAHLTDETGEQAGCDRTADRDREMARDPVARRSHRLDRAIQVGQETARPFREHTPGGGGLDTPPVAMQEVDAQLSFKRLQPDGEGRLGHVQPISGSRDRALLHDGEEALHGSDIHSEIV